jgi:hypothetical protein
MWATLALTTALNLAPAQTGLELKNQRLTYGILGQERKEATVLPGDVLWLAFDIEGMQVKDPGKDDRIFYSMGTRLTDSTGKEIFKKEAQELQVFNNLGGTHIPAYANVSVGADTMPGKYTFYVTVTDLTAKASKTLSQEFEVLSQRLGLVRLEFHYPYVQPTDGKLAPAPAQAAVGQPYLLDFTIVGWDLDPKTKNPDVLSEVQIYDEAGKPAMSRPLPGVVQKVEDEMLKKYRIMPMQYPLNLNRAGKFKIEITATDKVTGKNVKAALNLTVVEIK